MENNITDNTDNNIKLDETDAMLGWHDSIRNFYLSRPDIKVMKMTTSKDVNICYVHAIRTSSPTMGSRKVRYTWEYQADYNDGNWILTRAKIVK